MLGSLPRPLQAAKLAHLNGVLERAFGERPTVFRAGKLGLGRSTVGALLDAGYQVDSSIAPFNDLTPDGGADFCGAPCGVYRLAPEGDLRVPAPRGGLLEVPLSCGYTRLPFERWHAVHARLATPLGRALHAPGIAARAGIVKKVMMSPELDSAADMLALAARMVEQGAGFVHMFWHSTSFRPGLTPYTPTAAAVDALCARIERVVEGLDRLATLTFATVSEIARRPVAAAPGLLAGATA